MIPAIMICVGLVVSALGAFWAYRRQEGFKPKPAIMIFVGVMINAAGGLWASHQTDQLNQKIVGSMTGGDSFCYLTVANIDSVKNIGTFTLLHEGEYPLYDVQVKISDLDQLGEPSFEWLKGAISIGNIAANSAQMLDIIRLGNGDMRRFAVQVSARNGFLFQPLRLKKIDGEWVQATRVTRGWDKVIYEEIDDKFPRTAEGDVEW